MKPLSSGAQAAPAPISASWRAFAAIGVAVLVSQGNPYLVTSAFPLYLRHLGAAPARIGSEAGAAALMATLGTLIVGPSINRWGPRRLLLYGMICYLAAALGMLLLPNEVAATCFRALQGIGGALVIPSVLTITPRLVPLKPGSALGAVTAINTLAVAIGPPVGLALYARGGAPALLLPAALCALLGFGVGLFIPATPRPTEVTRGFGYDRRWTAPLLANTLNVAYFGGIVAYLPLVLAQGRGPNAGIFFTADAIGVLLLRVPTGMLVDRFGPRLPEVLGVVLTLLGIGALFLPPALYTLIVAGAGTGVGAGLFLSAILVTLATQSGEHNRGGAMALSSATFNIGLFAGSAISGLLIGPGGFNAILLFGSITTLLSLPLVLMARRAAAG